MDLRLHTGDSTVATVGGTAVSLASTLLADTPYAVVSSTACWLRQGTAKLVTCVAKASMVDTDFITITAVTAGGVSSTKVYEFDTAGDGVTAGRVQVNISADTTAATVAARLKTAIEANQNTVRVVDPGNGTLIIDIADSPNLTITEDVADAGFTIGAGIMQASAAAGSMYLPANTVVVLDGSRGAQLGVIQDAAGGKASCTFGRRR